MTYIISIYRLISNLNFFERCEFMKLIIKNKMRMIFCFFALSMSSFSVMALADDIPLNVKEYKVSEVYCFNTSHGDGLIISVGDEKISRSSSEFKSCKSKIKKITIKIYMHKYMVNDISYPISSEDGPYHFDWSHFTCQDNSKCKDSINYDFAEVAISEKFGGRLIFRNGTGVRHWVNGVDSVTTEKGQLFVLEPLQVTANDGFMRTPYGELKVMSYDEAIKACPAGKHLATIRELAEYFEKFGFIQITELPPGKNPSENNYYRVSGTNLTGSKDLFYFYNLDENGKARKKSISEYEFSSLPIWSSTEGTVRKCVYDEKNECKPIYIFEPSGLYPVISKVDLIGFGGQEEGAGVLCLP